MSAEPPEQTPDPHRRVEASELVAAQKSLLDGDLPGHPRLPAETLRAASTEQYETWLRDTCAAIGVTAENHLSVVAVGGLARREMVPGSDLDLILVHDRYEPAELAEIADRLWYPLWDAHLELDHSVRTVPQTLRVAATDMPAALALVQARHIAGDQELSALLVQGVRRQWRIGIRRRFPELVALTEQRWRVSGQINHRAQPDVKNGRGGLRDGQLLTALAYAQLGDPLPNFGPQAPGSGLAEAYRFLLDVRTEMGRIAGRSRDRLWAQDSGDIASALGLADRFELARGVSDAARTISHGVDMGLRQAAAALPRHGLARLRRSPLRRGLAEGVVEHGGEVALARGARPERDPVLVLRVGAAAAATQLPMAITTLYQLSEKAPELPQPWPRTAWQELLVLLASRGLVDTLEALDRTGLWGRLFPEWAAVRDLPPRDPVHLWTVDRHLIETVSTAALLRTRVARPDLLLLAALSHDLGKGAKQVGKTADHSVVGADIAGTIARRIGLPAGDIRTLQTIVRHHLLLPRTATTRNLSDPATIHDVLTALDNDATALDILPVLTEADSLATGTGVWTDWKATLIAEVTRRCRDALPQQPPPRPTPLPRDLLDRAQSGAIHVDLRPASDRETFLITIITPNQPGALAQQAGVLALHSLRVLSAQIGSTPTAAVNSFEVVPNFGRPPATDLVREQLRRAVEGNLDIAKALSDQATRPEPTAAQADPTLTWTPTVENAETVLEIRTEDRLGLLFRVATALSRQGVDIRWAKAVTLGSSAVDLFGLDTTNLPDQRLLARAVRQALIP